MKPPIADLFRLDGRVALVTGASSGIGARCAAVLHEAGADVVITARRSNRLRALADTVESRMTAAPRDLRDGSFRNALVDSVQREHGGLDILVNNAGVCDAGALELQSLSEVSDVLELNLLAAIDLYRLSSPLLFDCHWSSVINDSSTTWSSEGRSNGGHCCGGSPVSSKSTSPCYFSHRQRRAT